MTFMRSRRFTIRKSNEGTQMKLVYILRPRLELFALMQHKLLKGVSGPWGNFVPFAV